MAGQKSIMGSSVNDLNTFVKRYGQKICKKMSLTQPILLKRLREAEEAGIIKKEGECYNVSKIEEVLGDAKYRPFFSGSVKISAITGETWKAREPLAPESIAGAKEAIVQAPPSKAEKKETAPAAAPDNFEELRRELGAYLEENAEGAAAQAAVTRAVAPAAQGDGRKLPYYVEMIGHEAYMAVRLTPAYEKFEQDMFGLAREIASGDGGVVRKEDFYDALEGDRIMRSTETRKMAKVLVTKWTRRIANNIASSGRIPLYKDGEERRASTDEIKAVSAGLCKLVCDIERLESGRMRRNVQFQRAPLEQVSLEDACRELAQARRMDPGLVFDVLSHMKIEGRLTKEGMTWKEAELQRALGTAIGEGLSLWLSSSKTSGAVPHAGAAESDEKPAHYRALEKGAARELSSYTVDKTLVRAVLLGLEQEGKIVHTEHGYGKGQVKREFGAFMESHLTQAQVKKLVEEEFGIHPITVMKKWNAFKAAEAEKIGNAMKYGLYDKALIMELVRAEKKYFAKHRGKAAPVKHERSARAVYADLEHAAGKLKGRVWRTGINASVLKGLEAEEKINRAENGYSKAEVNRLMLDFRKDHWTEAELVAAISKKFGYGSATAAKRFAEQKEAFSAIMVYDVAYPKAAAITYITDHVSEFKQRPKGGKGELRAPREGAYKSLKAAAAKNKDRMWRTGIVSVVLKGLEKDGRIRAADGKYPANAVKDALTEFRAAHLTESELIDAISGRFDYVKPIATNKLAAFRSKRSNKAELAGTMKHGTYDKTAALALLEKHAEHFQKKWGRNRADSGASPAVQQGFTPMPVPIPPKPAAEKPPLFMPAKNSRPANTHAITTLGKLMEKPEAMKALATQIGTEDVAALAEKWLALIGGDVCLMSRKEIACTNNFNQKISTGNISLDDRNVTFTGLSALRDALMANRELMMGDHAAAQASIPAAEPMETESARPERKQDTEAQERERAIGTIGMLAKLDDTQVRRIEAEIGYSGVKPLFIKINAHVQAGGENFSDAERKAIWAFSQKVTGGMNISGNGMTYADLGRATRLIMAQRFGNGSGSHPARALAVAKSSGVSGKTAADSFDMELFTELKKCMGVQKGLVATAHDRPSPTLIRDHVIGMLERSPEKCGELKGLVARWQLRLDDHSRARKQVFVTPEDKEKACEETKGRVMECGFGPENVEFILGRVKTAIAHFEEMRAEQDDNYSRAVAVFEDTIFSEARKHAKTDGTFDEDAFQKAIGRISKKPMHCRIISEIARKWSGFAEDVTMRSKVAETGMSRAQLKKVVWAMEYAVKDGKGN